MSAHELELTVRALVAEGKGILAADESTGTVTKRLDAVGIDSTEEIRRNYRHMLVTAGAGGDIISGMILYDETIRQEDEDGTSFPQLLDQHGVIPGIKVDTGALSLIHI